ncbi:DUF1653 domain-containing protein [Undibacterium griseum]|uniref:DNA-directed DNA polymerase n=1 Tax=Undibacterium griseum TaxID=2762295 RepID=A0ABR6YQP3_9BURK|nr:DUF1653 domain-containing protein [Undibacterium griseum]MBC3886104.1 DUF1653 domain-containing protein [Undibacterium griseum]
MFEQAVVVIDFETSGMSPEQGGRVTEVAALRIVGGAVTERFVSLVNSRVRIPYFITELTGITQAMVDAAPPAEEVFPSLLAFIGDAALVAHNASFDEKFLWSESQRLGLQPAHQGVICSVKLARRICPGLPSYSLGPLAATLKIRFEGRAHRAEADAQVTADLMLHLATQLQQRYTTQAPINPQLLVQVNRLAAAKAPEFLQKYFTPPEHAAVTVAPPAVSIGHPQRFRHYKGGIYELVCEATQEADLSPVIVYRAQNGSIWTRPKTVFFEMLEIDGQRVQRFTPLTG